ncbi:MAG: type II toxin-antitoxin system VapC family toxin [Nitrospirales bacterium]
MMLKNRLGQFLSPLEGASFGRDAAAYGRLRATLEQKGTPIGSMDLLIAAHALSLAAPLVTNNTREFRRASPGYTLRTGSSKGGKTAIPRRAPLFTSKPITIRQGRNNSASSIKMYDYKTRPYFASFSADAFLYQ